jgi:hypothetical protein
MIGLMPAATLPLVKSPGAPYTVAIERCDRGIPKVCGAIDRPFGE